MLDPDEAHINTSLTSTRLSDGATQAPILGPSITSGTRRELTDLDVAFLNDMGYTIVPEVSGFLILTPMLLGAAVGVRRRPRADSRAA